MAIFESREQLSERMQTLIGERTDDDALNFIRDALETYDSRTSPEGTITQAEHARLMAEQDTTWRQRYRDTFFGKPDPSFSTKEGANTSKSDPAASVPGSSEINPADFNDLFG